MSSTWQTPEDLLPIGKGDAYFVLDNQLVDFQLSATDTDTATGQKLNYFIGSGDGVLPPGLSLSSTGKISGIVDPILALTQETGNGGFDSTNMVMQRLTLLPKVIMVMKVSFMTV